jgi:hypothetical protein
MTAAQETPVTEEMRLNAVLGEMGVQSRPESDQDQVHGDAMPHAHAARFRALRATPPMLGPVQLLLGDHTSLFSCVS